MDWMMKKNSAQKIPCIMLLHCLHTDLVLYSKLETHTLQLIVDCTVDSSICPSSKDLIRKTLPKGQDFHVSLVSLISALLCSTFCASGQHLLEEPIPIYFFIFFQCICLIMSVNSENRTIHSD